MLANEYLGRHRLFRIDVHLGAGVILIWGNEGDRRSSDGSHGKECECEVPCDFFPSDHFVSSANVTPHWRGVPPWSFSYIAVPLRASRTVKAMVGTPSCFRFPSLSDSVDFPLRNI